MTYEAHITFPNSQRRQVKRHAGGWGFSRMLGDPYFGSGKYCYLTTHDDNLEYLVGLVNIKAATLRNLHGITALRLKIEEEVYDERLA